ncbi:MAG TPA: hypothetical protein PLJ62_09540 [Thermoflexales bacterium]|nr:hypothetical protein [Thermoflexales bacterium]HQW34025.1 hypothetical protein [Thermoflexales bacterium]HQZ22178.1 hypothetical protein [Thermoflexales bacterium]HRA00428.1 hypothetical protein [Thermoflexales bacterium]
MSRSVLHGGFLGVIFAEVYVFLFVTWYGVVTLLLPSLFSGTEISQLGYALIGAFGWPICGVPFGSLIGFVLGGVLGSVGGFLTGLFTLIFRRNLTAKHGILAGACAGVVLVITTGFLLEINTLTSHLVSGSGLGFLFLYGFWYACPAAFVIGGMAYLGWWLAREEVGAAGAKA